MDSGTQHTDKELWDSFRAGSRIAYEQIYGLYVRTLYNYGYKIAQDRPLVEDCIQDVFLNLLEYRDRLSPTTSIKFYLFRAIRREIVRRLRESNRFESDAEPAFHALFEVEASWLDSQVGRDQIDDLLKALNQLPARQKEAIHLRFFDNLSYEEVASVMGIEQTSAYKIIYKALDNLQKRVTFNVVVLLLGLTGQASSH